MNWDMPKARIYDYLHQPGEITQDFADVVNTFPGCELQKIYANGSWDLVCPNTVSFIVNSISQVLLVLHACDIEIDWPKK